MGRAHTQGGRRTLTLLSAPSVCEVCRDDRVVRLAAIAGIRGAGTVACPHCSGGTQPIPIVTLPMRQDRPSGDAA